MIDVSPGYLSYLGEHTRNALGKHDLRLRRHSTLFQHVQSQHVAVLSLPKCLMICLLIVRGLSKVQLLGMPNMCSYVLEMQTGRRG
ncbi:unnamed protein product [Fusarium graminearum]|nr:unnamed protein product [Fusarium graminearum]